MPISLACPCGKQLRLKDEAAGRHIRCPACGNVLLVPAAPDEPTEQPSPEEFLRSLAQSGDQPPAAAPGQPEESANAGEAEQPPPGAAPVYPSGQTEQAGAPPESPFPDVPLAHDGMPPPFSFSTNDRLKRNDRFARIAVFIIRVFAWLGLAGALVYALITLVGILLVALSTKGDVRVAATALTGLVGFGFILATLASAAFGWALFIALASITENLIEIRRNGQRRETRSGF